MGILPFLSLLVLLALSVRLLYGRRKQPLERSTLPPEPPTFYEDLDDCKHIIGGIDGTLYGFQSVLNPLESRAAPNQRLVHIFNIDNAFTTTDFEYYQSFRKRVKVLLNINEERWKHLAETATKLVRYGIQARALDGSNGTIALVGLVQTVTLKLSIHALFYIPIIQLDDDDIAIIASKINTLWMVSKGSNMTDSTLSDQQALFAALRSIIPHKGTSPRNNPLNIILPAYETMWRVVLRAFLEVRFRSGDSGPNWRHVLTTFLATPSRAQYETPQPGADNISLAFIVNEALRLYPPTRRIYRHEQPWQDGESKLLAADIESLHRNPMIWGQDSLLFKPARWAEVDERCRNAFLPFGSKPFTCPAKGDTGPRMIGVLIAALVEVIDDEWECKAVRAEDSIDGEGPLVLGRDSYMSLELGRVFA